MIQKLELTWVWKNNKIRLEPRILVEDESKSYGDTDSWNMLIHGDNLLALKALEQDYTGKIKCIYIDPPYNTGNAFEHYDDGLEHSEWLNLMKPRIEILFKLLSDDWIMAIQIDDNEYARLFLLVAEIFWQKNLKTICVKMSEATWVKMAQVIKSWIIPKLKEYIILCSKKWVRNIYLKPIPKGKWDNEYKVYIDGITREEIDELKYIIDNESRSILDISRADSICSKFILKPISEIFTNLWIEKNLQESFMYENAWRIVRTCSTSDGAKKLSDIKRDKVIGAAFVIITPKKKAYIMIKDYDIMNSQPRIKLLFADDYLSVHPWDFWDDIKTTWLGDEGGIWFKNWKKPEQLLNRIINMCTQPGDIVLDSFIGSGTTVAVAHKMWRKWIGIELWDHAYTHCKVRLDKVINGSDSGGISQAVNWKWWWGYKFYELGPSLMQKDERGRYIINPEMDGESLVKALCKIENFKYLPRGESDFIKHGYSTERDFLHVTTRHIDQEMINSIQSKYLSSDESILIFAKSFSTDLKLPANIQVKKIPTEILRKCEYAKDNYSLPVLSDTEEDDVIPNT